ncbi:uncharacterized protein METZ01_LOCUS95619 [marine metagenome]|uniref:Uncharacterized protein n=1 Tax=marine metagenome TaxID=408172 RepID=A0A381VR20_9ZZZZ|tara:strand:- start:1191 stop:2549 length:1359 start_codon:yes stop_codon:yes gene_type:complete
MVENFAQNTQEIVSVSELNKKARKLLEKNFPFVWVEGEVSNFFSASSGHWYFSLKDSDSEIRCAMFANKNDFIQFLPKDGDKLIVNGSLSIYEGRGQYQLIIEYAELAGQGALLRAFEDLKKKLINEGLFDIEKKKPLPSFVKHIAVVTSEDGSVFKDIVNVLGRRSPTVTLTLVPTMVQGENAENQIIKALKRASELNTVQTIILARGGGSMEDLWSFNSESLAREIAKCKVPIISAIGHETDYTISDFVSDVRAPTPSAAAEMISQSHTEILSKLLTLTSQITDITNARLINLKDTISFFRKRMVHPKNKLNQILQRIDDLELRLVREMIQINFKNNKRLQLVTNSFSSSSNKLELKAKKNKNHELLIRLFRSTQETFKTAESNLTNLTSTLDAVSPLSVLGRGYSIITKDNSKEIIKSDQQVKKGEIISARLKKGYLKAKILRRNSDEK